jgi:hypothetical protein
MLTFEEIKEKYGNVPIRFMDINIKDNWLRLANNQDVFLSGQLPSMVQSG